MCNKTAAFFMLDAERSKKAFSALVQEWQGILARDGYAV